MQRHADSPDPLTGAHCGSSQAEQPTPKYALNSKPAFNYLRQYMQDPLRAAAASHAGWGGREASQPRTSLTAGGSACCSSATVVGPAECRHHVAASTIDSATARATSKFHLPQLPGLPAGKGGHHQAHRLAMRRTHGPDVPATGCTRLVWGKVTGAAMPGAKGARKCRALQAPALPCAASEQPSRLVAHGTV